MTALGRLLTVDDLETFPSDGKRYEVIGGELIVSPAPSQRHQLLQLEIAALLRDHVRPHRLGRAYTAPVDVRFTAIDQVQPDVVVLLKERRHIYTANVMHGPPDLAVEIISPSSRQTDPTVKYRLYEQHGVKEYWLVDPEARTLRLFALRDGRYVESQPKAGTLHSEVLPGLTVDLAALFAELDR